MRVTFGQIAVALYMAQHWRGNKMRLMPESIFQDFDRALPIYKGHIKPRIAVQSARRTGKIALGRGVDALHLPIG